METNEIVRFSKTVSHLAASFLGVRIKSRFMRFSEMFDFREKPLTSPLFKHVANFESAKLGRFGTTFYDRT